MKLWLFSSLCAVILSCLPLLAQQQVVVTLHNPDSSVRFAAADILTVPQEERQYIRYLSLYNVPKEQRKTYGAIVSFMCNSLGTRRKTYIPLFVGGSDETVIRINIDDYEWTGKIWDNFASTGSGPKPTPEPYFHSFVEGIDKSINRTKKVQKQVAVTKKEIIAYQGQTPITRNVITYETQTVEVDDPIFGRIFTTAAWVDPKSMALLQQETTASSPILRADWFIGNASIPPAYYNFLRLGKDVKDFQKMIFADLDLAKKARSEDRGVVIISAVARNNRTLVRTPTFTKGYYWFSLDSLKSVEERQYVQNVLHNEFDATEDIGTLPNGLQAYFLTDGKGKRIDVANPDIAIDDTAIDRQVRTGRSCIACHVEGIRPIDDEIRALTKKLTDKNEIKLLITRREDARKIEDLFSSNLDEQIVADQNLYLKAISNTNGLTSTVNAKAFNDIYNNYFEIVLTRETVSRELGLSERDLDRYIKLSNDPVVLGLLKTPIRNVRRDQWERSFQQMMLIVRLQQPIGIVPPQILVPRPK
jgi:hypothetical protein